MKLFRFTVEAARNFAQTTLIMCGISTRSHLSRLQIQEDSQIRDTSLSSQQRELFNKLATYPPRCSLIGNAGVKTPVADYQSPSIERGENHRCKVLCTVGLK